jgi:hypothetical protein
MQVMVFKYRIVTISYAGQTHFVSCFLLQAHMMMLLQPEMFWHADKRLTAG